MNFLRTKVLIRLIKAIWKVSNRNDKLIIFITTLIILSGAISEALIALNVPQLMRGIANSDIKSLDNSQSFYFLGLTIFSAFLRIGSQKLSTYCASLITLNLSLVTFSLSGLYIKVPSSLRV